MTAQADAPRVLREVAETSAAQAKENFEKLSAAAGDAANLLKTVCIQSGALPYVRRSLDHQSTALCV
jgi:hypothetical protein